jgi:hypothetical protein
MLQEEEREAHSPFLFLSRTRTTSTNLLERIRYIPTQLKDPYGFDFYLLKGLKLCVL